MSFYINNNNQCKPGGICGNPLNGICEKALIEVDKVFDACRYQAAETGLSLALSDFDPAGPALPLTFISATNDPDNPAKVSDVVIDRIDNRPNFANVSATVTIPLNVTYRDANGVLGTASATYTTQENVILFVPQASVIPAKIEALGVFTSTLGTISTDGVSATVTACIQIVLKVVARVDLLVPSYGYPMIPACQSSSVSICPGVSELPLFPTAIK